MTLINTELVQGPAEERLWVWGFSHCIEDPLVAFGCFYSLVCLLSFDTFPISILNFIISIIFESAVS